MLAEPQYLTKKNRFYILKLAESCSVLFLGKFSDLFTVKLFPFRFKFASVH